jgi:AcrR family transcriptional regulator
VAPKQAPEARRQAILEAAIDVFARLGFGAATTDDIARAAGLSKGGLYWHFKSKDELLAAILHSMFDQELQRLQGLIQTSDSASNRLRSLVKQATAAMAQFEQALPVILDFYALAARDGAVRQFMQAYYQRYHRLLAELFEQGFADGEFHRATPAEAATTLIGQLEGLGLLWAIAPAIVRLPEQSAVAVELLLNGLAVPGQ